KPGPPCWASPLQYGHAIFCRQYRVHHSTSKSGGAVSRSRSDTDVRGAVPAPADGRGPASADAAGKPEKTGKPLNTGRNRNFQYSDQVADAIDEIDHLIGAGKFVAGQRLVE